MPERTNRAMVTKMFRFTPELVEDMERVVVLAQEGGKLKYPSMTNFAVLAITERINRERRVLEDAGIVWEHLRPGFKKSLKEE